MADTHYRDIFHYYTAESIERNGGIGTNTLVTGGAGFIGSHLVDALCKRRDNVCSADIKVPTIHNPHIRSYWRMDVAKLERDWLGEFDEVYHLAARPWCMVKDADKWFNESQQDFSVNTLGTYNVLRRTTSDLFVLASTSALYGDGRKFKETSPLNVFSPYAYSKAIAERIVSESSRRYVILRFGSVIGVRGRVFLNRLIWCAINKVPIDIFNDGNISRDLIDVRDIVSALMSSSKLDNGIYNVSCGMEISTRELVEIVSRVAEERGYKPDYRFTDFKLPGLVLCSTLDNSKILDTGVWEPVITLEQSIEDMFNYYESPINIEPPSWDDVL